MRNGYYDNIDKIGKALNDAVPNFSKITSDQITALTNPVNLSAFSTYKNIANDKINEIIRPISNFYKALEPNICNYVNILSEIYSFFDKIMRNEYELKNEIYLKWKNLEDELKNNNRSFPSSDFLSLFKVCVDEANYSLDEGSILYIARKINETDFSPVVRSFFKQVSDKFNEYEYQKQFEKEKDIWSYLSNLSSDELELLCNNECEINNIAFWGYNAISSDAPPSGKAISGRANPAGITCLYAALEPMTAISEIQPTIGQIISVAEIRTRQKLKLFNFDFYEAFTNDLFEKSLVEFKKEKGISFENFKIIFETISEIYSRPSLGNTENYYATQYLTDYIKSKGFDGLIFNSSLMERGKNIVLFDTSKDDIGTPKNYTVKNSLLYKIDKVKIQCKELLPKIIEKI